VWLTAGIGLAVGTGQLWLPLIATLLAWVVLAIVGHVPHE
jgi:uncharacterized membrane protein YhiD involved in acid resistance